MNTSLAPINKFSYLKTLLTGKAKDALNSLERTSENYDEAVAILKSRFGDPQVVIQSNINILLVLHPVSSSSNITDLRKIYYKVEAVSRNLQRFEVHAEHFGPILKAVLVEKLPSDLHLQVSRNTPQGKWEISKLLDEFEKELLSRERKNILNSDKLSSSFKIIEAIVVPTFFSSLSGQFIELAKNQYTHLNNIQLSDRNVNNSDSQIDVLIAADHYWDYMTGEVKRASKGPVAIKTILRWVLNGTFQSQSSRQTSVNLCN